MSRVELFRALFDVNVDLPGAGHDRNQKTGERFVLDKEFAADERVRGGERPSIAVSCIGDYVRNDALEEAIIDLNFHPNFPAFLFFALLCIIHAPWGVCREKES